MTLLNVVPILTCEHATAFIPKYYASILQINPSVLATHRGWDLGAKQVCQQLSSRLQAKAFYAKTSRLLIDLNRTTVRKACFSNYSKKLTDEDRKHLLAVYYQPYRQAIEDAIACVLDQKNTVVLHLSIHSFTSRLSGKVRNNDVGVLYDPKRSYERIFAKILKNNLLKTSQLYTRFNYPYLGAADGLTTALRKVFSAKRYIGVEIELNQKWIGSDGCFLKPLIKSIVQGIEASLSDIVININQA